MKSVIIQRLELGLIDSAIIIMDGTDLFNNPLYQEAKAKWESQYCTEEEFCKIVEPLYRDWAKKHGLEFD